MKVLITTDCYVPTINGVVVSTMNLKNELMKRGHEVKILTLSETRHSYEKEGDIYIGSTGASFVYPEARITFPRNNRFIQELINWKPDIVHSQSEFSTFIMARRIAKKLQIPILQERPVINLIRKMGKSICYYFYKFNIEKCAICNSPK